MTKEKTVFPKTILAKMERDGDESYLLVGETPSELGCVDEPVARYVLAGIGEIKYVAPRYEEA